MRNIVSKELVQEIIIAYDKWEKKEDEEK